MSASLVGQGPLRVLVVEDDDRMREILTRHLDRMGYAVRGAAGGAEALGQLDEQPADVVVTDVRMPGIDGRTLLPLVLARHPGTKVVLMTAFGSVDDAVQAIHAGAYTYVCKPFKVEELAAVLRNASREVSLAREADGLRRAIRERWSADRLIGQSAPMQAVRSALREAAGSNATMLLTGRSGTGKELAARAIHFDGPRASHPFVPVNCAALPESLFESALFGHRRGAYTGAVETHVGFMEQAHLGTLFLDEIADIPLTQQAKLLRALQEGEVTPLASARPVRVDVRVVCATNRDLEDMVRRGAFREDLYYRINVLRLVLPGLDERPEDIPALAEALLVEVARQHGSPALGLTPAALELLSRRRWPGNVRELRNVIERALLQARGRRVDVGDLPASAGGSPSCPAGSSTPIEGLRSLADMEREHISRVLAACGWNRAEAARVLGIDRRTLFSKIQRYGLVGPLRPGPAGDSGDSPLG